MTEISETMDKIWASLESDAVVDPEATRAWSLLEDTLLACATALKTDPLKMEPMVFSPSSSARGHSLWQLELREKVPVFVRGCCGCEWAAEMRVEVRIFSFGRFVWEASMEFRKADGRGNFFPLAVQKGANENLSIDECATFKSSLVYCLEVLDMFLSASGMVLPENDAFHKVLNALYAIPGTVSAWLMA